MPKHRDASQAIELKGHAVVLGGGIAGMLAVGVLADHFELVMIIERRSKDSVGTAAATPATNRSTIPAAAAQILSNGLYEFERGWSRSCC